MSTLLLVVGAFVAILGIALIPLPGPGFLVLTVGALLLTAGFLILKTSTRASG